VGLMVYESRHYVINGIRDFADHVVLQRSIHKGAIRSLLLTSDTDIKTISQSSYLLLLDKMVDSEVLHKSLSNHAQRLGEEALLPD